MNKVSIIVPAFNEEDNITRLIDSVSAIQHEKYQFEVFVIDNCSTDKTAAVAAEAGAFVQTSDIKPVAALRNIGVENTSSDLLIFLDADVSVTKSWHDRITGILDHLLKHPCDIFGSHCSSPGIDKSALERYWFDSFENSSSSHLGSGHMIMTRSFFSSVGGFNVNMETGEDYDFCQKAVSIGGRICEVPDLKVVHHDYPKTIKAFVLRERWHGSGDVSALKKVMKSKVALASLLFILLHFFCVLFLFIDPLLSFFVLTLLLAFLVFLSFRKFKRKGAFIIFTNTFYYYFYFVGRSASFINLLKIRKK